MLRMTSSVAFSTAIIEISLLLRVCDVSSGHQSNPSMILGANEKDARDNQDRWIQNKKENKNIIDIARDLKGERQCVPFLNQHRPWS